MTIRKTTMQDLDTVMGIYDDGRTIMRESGNAAQWQGGHPNQEKILRDIASGSSYVCLDSGEIIAVFYFAVTPDPTYAKIDGAWLNDLPYGVIHRIARRKGAKGVGAFCINWCFEQHRNIRLDTHCDNVPMRNLMDKLGFTYRGIIWLETGDERMAFQKCEI